MNMRRSLYAVAGILAALALTAAHVATQTQTALPLVTTQPIVLAATTTPNVYPIIKVVDGDTDDVLMNGKTVRLRLIGMDTPEVVDSRKPVQCFGREASNEGHTLLDGQYVRLEFDPPIGQTDKYGRTLAYVFLLDGTFYNEFMIRNGYAHEYTYNNQHYKYQVAFKAAQKAAQSEQKGFWSPQTCDGNTTKPAGSS